MPPIGPAELIIILVIALLILGPGKLPDVGAALGRSLREFRRASSDFQEATRMDTPPANRGGSTPTSSSPAAPPTPDAMTPTAPPAAPQHDSRTEPSAEPRP